MLDLAVDVTPPCITGHFPVSIFIFRFSLGWLSNFMCPYVGLRLLIMWWRLPPVFTVRAKIFAVCAQVAK
jgi:hypothetical protein